MVQHKTVGEMCLNGVNTQSVESTLLAACLDDTQKSPSGIWQPLPSYASVWHPGLKDLHCQADVGG